MENRNEFEKRMTRTYPLLYSDMYGNPCQTSMAFGFDVRPGWYSIIEDLSLKLENLIIPIYNEAMENKSSLCYGCGRVRKFHWLFYIYYTVIYYFKNRRKAMGLFSKWRKRDKWLKKPLWRTLYFILFKFRWYRPCKKWVPLYPKASQIKEKFGTLRVYMTYETNEIERFISEAENLSSKTCEECGSIGVLRNDTWIRTLCDKCVK